MDVRTSGSLSRSTKEEFNQCVEIIDSGASLPPPTLGDEALPFYDVEDDDDEDDDQDDEDDDEGNVTTSGIPSTRRKSRRKTSKKTPSPKSKILARKKKEKEEKEEAVESALEAHQTDPDRLSCDALYI